MAQLLILFSRARGVGLPAGNVVEPTSGPVVRKSGRLRSEQGEKCGAPLRKNTDPGHFVAQLPSPKSGDAAVAAIWLLEVAV